MRRVSRHFSAPPVRYPVGQGVLLFWGLLSLLVGTSAALLFWLLHGAGDSVARLSVAVVLWLGAACALVHFWRRRTHGVLQWDGSRWSLDIEPAGDLVHPLEGALWVRLDLQSHLWVCLDSPHGRSTWLWLERKDAPERWGDLRRAVYSRPVPGTSQVDAPVARGPQA